MNVEQALTLADSLIFAETAKHLNTLQVAIFRGAWANQKYDQLAEQHYCSETHVKMVGSELWEILSKGLKERVSKKTFRAALERRASFAVTTNTSITSIPDSSTTPLLAATELACPSHVKTFICHSDRSSDLILAKKFAQSLQALGHQTFLAFDHASSDNHWSQNLQDQLTTCDYFFLLLSQQSTISEVVTEIVRQVRQLQEVHPVHKPKIVLVSLEKNRTLWLNYELRGYLNTLPSYQWQAPSDTPMLLEKLTSNGTAEQAATTEINSKTVPGILPVPERLDQPPLPTAEPEFPEGQIEIASKFYIERPPIESRCYDTIVKPGALIRIKAPRQMGKTSMLARILYRASLEGCRTVSLNFQLADSQIFQDLDRLLRWLCASIGRKLGLPNRIGDYWDEIFGSKTSCQSYFEEYLLAQLDSPLVVGLDEVDRVFQFLPLADDFFALLRAFHEEAKSSEVWKKLRLVVVHSTEVYIPLNINQSPFNVGLPVELPEFLQGQVQDLAHRHGLNLTQNQVEQLMTWVGGHPYLVRVALYHIARQEMMLEKLIQLAPTETSPYKDHLRRHLLVLKQQPELAAAFKTVVTATHPVRLEYSLLFKLYSMGLVRLQGNEVTPLCELYRQYFGERLD